MHKLFKQLIDFEKKYLILKILVLVKEQKQFNNVIEYLDGLFKTSYSISDLTNKENYNILDNNLFEIENYLEDLNVVLNTMVKMETFIFLDSKDKSYLIDLYNLLVNIIKEEETVSSSIKNIILYQKIIITKYLNVLKDANILIDSYYQNMCALFEKDHFLKSDWNYIYKITNQILKQNEDIKHEIYREKLKFEVSYFLVNMEG